MIANRDSTLFTQIQKTTARVSKPRVSRTKGHLSKRTAFVRSIVQEVAGYVITNFNFVNSNHLRQAAVFSTNPIKHTYSSSTPGR